MAGSVDRSLVVLACGLAFASSGCMAAVLGGFAVVGGTLAPPVIGMTAVPGDSSTAQATLAAGGVGGAPGHDGGWGVSLDTASVTTGYIAHGHLELGRYGRDGFYGYSGAEAGVGFGGGGFGAGLMVGYGYGGMPQNGHQVPLRLMGFAALGPIDLRLSGYVGWRFGVRDEYPAATSDFGPGWNTYGADLAMILLLKGHGGGIGVAGSIGIDRQDDIDAAWFKLGVGVAIAE